MLTKVAAIVLYTSLILFQLAAHLSAWGMGKNAEAEDAAGFSAAQASFITFLCLSFLLTGVSYYHLDRA
jgi:hypothetical protein